MPKFGYAGKILRLDLSSQTFAEFPTEDYADSFLGGRGVGAKIFWDEVPPEVNVFDAENRLIFATGPLAGIPVIAGSRWEVYGKSPASSPHHFSYCNLGGRWGADLKFAGYDAVVVQGKSEKPVYILIHDNTMELKDASQLWSQGSIETRVILKEQLGQSISVAAIGPAGESLAVMANILAENDASGSGGMGAVMGSKKLKAIAVKRSGRGIRVAQPERLRELTTYYRGLKRVAIPISTYRYSVEKVPSFGNKMKMEPCYGCMGCFVRRRYEADDGKKGKYMCLSAMFYQPWAMSYYGGWNEVAFYATKLVDTYGLDAKAIDLVIGWLNKCYEAGILSDENSGLPISKIGSLEFIEALVKKISFRQDLGDRLADGLGKAAQTLGTKAEELVEKVGYLGNPKYNDLYGPRLYPTNAIFYATEPRLSMPQLHEVNTVVAKWVPRAGQAAGAVLPIDAVRRIAKRFWGSELAADLSTFEGKALAAVKIQDREYAKACLILCDYPWPIAELAPPGDQVGDPSLESKILSAVTGVEFNEEGLYRIGERVFNLQRAILVREGHRGRDFDRLPEKHFTIPQAYDQINPECLVPGKGGEVVSKKGAVVDRKEFERMKDEYYSLRKWDIATGLQTRATLEALGLKDVADDLEKRGLIAQGGQRITT
jgi:aldehyde:ferredoxin oxidoreductase